MRSKRITKKSRWISPAVEKKPRESISQDMIITNKTQKNSIQRGYLFRLAYKTHACSL
jgi:hypothetical protein